VEPEPSITLIDSSGSTHEVHRLKCISSGLGSCSNLTSMKHTFIETLVDEKPPDKIPA